MEHVPSADVTELELPEQETIDKTNEKDEQSEDIQLKSTCKCLYDVHCIYIYIPIKQNFSLLWHFSKNFFFMYQFPCPS